MVKPKLEETDAHLKLRQAVLTKMGTWRRFVVAIDGHDDVGKSSFARYLAWQTGIALVETDLFLISTKPLNHRYQHLEEVVNARRIADRPIIVEGIQVLQILSRISVEPDFLVRISANARGSGILMDQFAVYEEQYGDRLSHADLHISWDPA